MYSKYVERKSIYLIFHLEPIFVFIFTRYSLVFFYISQKTENVLRFIIKCDCLKWNKTTALIKQNWTWQISSRSNLLIVIKKLFFIHWFKMIINDLYFSLHYPFSKNFSANKIKLVRLFLSIYNKLSNV